MSGIVAHNIKTGKRHVLLDIVNVIYTNFPDKVVNHLIDQGIVFKASGGFTVDDRELGKYIEVSQPRNYMSHVSIFCKG